MAVVACQPIIFTASTWCCLLMLLSTVSGQATDYTLVSQATGAEVVDAVVDLITQSCIFYDDYLMLRRIASAETKDGQDPRTFSHSNKAFYGGIWQVSEESFRLTKSSADKTIYCEIKSVFNIDWTTVTYKDLWKPLYSGLAAMLSIDSYYSTSNSPVDVESQALFWAQHYTINFWGSVNDAVNIYKQASRRIATRCRSPKADVVFVLDSSRSIGEANFAKVREFVVDVVRSFVIGSDNVRVSVIQFGDDARIEFDLTSYHTTTELVSAINKIQFMRGMTNMAAGLEALESVVTNSKRHGVAMVAVVLTDGESNIPTTTAAARVVKRLHQTLDDKIQLTIYSIGVGDAVNSDELDAIASKPSCQYVFQFSSFGEITAFSYQLMSEACQARAKLSTTEQVSQVSGVLGAEENYFFEANAVKQKNGIEIEVETFDNGALEVYLSRTVRNPSPVLHDYSFDVNSKRRVKLLVPWPEDESVGSRPSSDDVSRNAITSTVTLYGAIRGVGEKSDGNRFVMSHVVSEKVEKHIFLIIYSSILSLVLASLLFQFEQQDIVNFIKRFDDMELYVIAAAIAIIIVDYELVGMIASDCDCSVFSSEVMGITTIFLIYGTISCLWVKFRSEILKLKETILNNGDLTFVILAILLVVVCSIVVRNTTKFFDYSSVLSKTTEITTSFLSNSTHLTIVFAVPMAVICYKIVQTTTSEEGISSISSISLAFALAILSFVVVANIAALLGSKSSFSILVETARTFIDHSSPLCRNADTTKLSINSSISLFDVILLILIAFLGYKLCFVTERLTKYSKSIQRYAIMFTFLTGMFYFCNLGLPARCCIPNARIS